MSLSYDRVMWRFQSHRAERWTEISSAKAKTNVENSLGVI